jgi:hypothetical protein
MAKAKTKKKPRLRGGFSPLSVLVPELTKRGIFWQKDHGYAAHERIALKDGITIDGHPNGLTVMSGTYDRAEVPCTNARDLHVDDVIVAVAAVHQASEEKLLKVKIAKEQLAQRNAELDAARAASGFFAPGNACALNSRVTLNLYNLCTDEHIFELQTYRTVWHPRGTPEQAVELAVRFLTFLDELDAVCNPAETKEDAPQAQAT